MVVVIPGFGDDGDIHMRMMVMVVVWWCARSKGTIKLHIQQRTSE
jgi:hypothetical protein